MKRISPNKLNFNWYLTGFTATSNLAIVKYRLTASQNIVLAYIGWRSQNGNIKVHIQNREIIKVCELSKNTVATALYILEKHKMIERTFLGTNNNRRVSFNIKNIRGSGLPF